MTNLEIAKCRVQRECVCVATNKAIHKGDESYWVKDHGLFHGSLTADDITAFVAKNPTAPTEPDKISDHDKKLVEDAVADLKNMSDDMDYEVMSEVLACELEDALAALTRRGITPAFDTDGLAEYRTAHPRQDS